MPLVLIPSHSVSRCVVILDVPVIIAPFVVVAPHYAHIRLETSVSPGCCPCKSIRLHPAVNAESMRLLLQALFMTRVHCNYNCPYIHSSIRTPICPSISPFVFHWTAPRR